MRSVSRLLLVLSFVVFCAPLALSQTTVGVQKFGAYDGFPDTIDLGSLGMHLEIPLFSKAGRGSGTGISVVLNNYVPSSSYWVISPAGTIYYMNQGPSVRVSVPGSGTVSSTSQDHNCDRYGQGTYTDYAYKYVDARGNTDLTGVFCTSGSEREFTLKERWYANKEIQAGADRNAATAD